MNPVVMKAWLLNYSIHLEHFHFLVAEVIDYFHGDAARLGFTKRSGGVAVQSFPGFLVDLDLQCGFEGFIRIVRSQKISVPDKEALLIVIGVDEPASDALSSVTAHLAGVGVKHI